eukprot:g1930.t1
MMGDETEKKRKKTKKRKRKKKKKKKEKEREKREKKQKTGEKLLGALQNRKDAGRDALRSTQHTLSFLEGLVRQSKELLQKSCEGISTSYTPSACLVSVLPPSEDAPENKNTENATCASPAKFTCEELSCVPASDGSVQISAVLRTTTIKSSSTVMLGASCPQSSEWSVTCWSSRSELKKGATTTLSATMHLNSLTSLPSSLNVLVLISVVIESDTRCTTRRLRTVRVTPSAEIIFGMPAIVVPLLITIEDGASSDLRRAIDAWRGSESVRIRSATPKAVECDLVGKSNVHLAKSLNALMGALPDACEISINASNPHSMRLLRNARDAIQKEVGQTLEAEDSSTATRIQRQTDAAMGLLMREFAWVAS